MFFFLLSNLHFIFRNWKFESIVQLPIYWICPRGEVLLVLQEQQDKDRAAHRFQEEIQTKSKKRKTIIGWIFYKFQ